MPDIIADVMLGFSHVPMLFFISLLGSLYQGPRLFWQTACLIALDIIVNVTLKGSFKIPLSPALHKVGYAFPSGHMQMVTVFYIWWAYIFPSWRYIIVVITILIGIGAGLIHYGYHDVYDVGGGFIFGVALVYGYCSLRKKNKHFTAVLFIVATAFMMCNLFLYTTLPIYVCVAYGGIVLLILAERIFIRAHPSTSP